VALQSFVSSKVYPIEVGVLLTREKLSPSSGVIEAGNDSRPGPSTFSKTAEPHRRKKTLTKIARRNTGTCTHTYRPGLSTRSGCRTPLS
jgi:hypothetical protein